MKKILSVIFFYLLFSNISFAKILDVGTHKLEVPSNFYLINWSDTNYGKDICKDFTKCYGVVDKTVK